TATGPYPGTFTETGTWSLDSQVFSATFTITSGTTIVTGSKTAPFSGLGTFSFSCAPDSNGTVLGSAPAVPDTATIHTPSGNFHDQGVSSVAVTITGPAAAQTETFTSSLAQPILLAPTSKDQCKNGGWQNYPQFKNQGQCVSFV